MGPEEFEKHQKELIDELISTGSEQMKKKLMEKMKEGFFGFDKIINYYMIFDGIQEHLNKKWTKDNCIDLANLFLMLWNLHRLAEEERHDQNP